MVSFDGRVMLLRYIDPEIAGRYGTGVYVRCAPSAGGVAQRRNSRGDLIRRRASFASRSSITFPAQPIAGEECRCPI